MLYWAAWRIVPGYFGYEFVPRKETLEDGTVVTLVRSAFFSALHSSSIYTLQILPSISVVFGLASSSLCGPPCVLRIR